jgi:hypothetical protein
MPLFALVGIRGKKQCPQYIFFIVLVLLILTSDEIKVRFKKVFRKVFQQYRTFLDQITVRFDLVIT